jgi:hypothetical protein
MANQYSGLSARSRKMQNGTSGAVLPSAREGPNPCTGAHSTGRRLERSSAAAIKHLARSGRLEPFCWRAGARRCRRLSRCC